MSKLRFIIDNYIDNSTITANPTMDVNLPIENVKDPTRSKVTRSVANSNQSIRGTFSSVKDVSGIVLGRHNFILDMQYKISLYNNNGLDYDYINTGGTESANDTFYIAGSYASIFSGGVNFDLIGDSSYIDACTGGTNNNLIDDVFKIAGDKTSSYIVGVKFEYTGDTTSNSNRVYTITGSTFNSVDTEITVMEEANGALFDGTLNLYARYIVNTGGSSDNSTTYAVTGGIDNTTPTDDIFYITGDQTSIFNRATSVTCSNDTNTASNITYSIVSIFYNSGATRTEITVAEDITGHNFDGDLLPIYTSIPVVTNIIGTPTFDGKLLPDFLIWESSIKTITTETLGSNLWEWGSFLWGIEAWGADRIKEEFSPPSNIVEWINSPQVNCRGFKIELFSAGSSISYFEIGRLIIGKYIQPTYNIGYGHSLTWEENTKQYRTESGSLRSDISIPYRKLEFNLGTITESDRILLQNELRNSGLRKDLFVSLFPEDVSLDKQIDYSAIVKLTKIPKFTEFALNYYKSKYTMEEV